ncbi:MAG: hypothetical protein HZB56_03590 [Deltaproteobacteria bacterium]|nr:hypothetical protein [Deltaproteobacteria bacterium]
MAGAACALLLLLTLAACGQPRPHCSFTEAGTCYVVEAGRPSADALHRAREQAEGVWGAGVLSGWTVRLAPATDCSASSDACALLDEREIVIRWVSPCSLALLIHEAGHAAVGDPHHLDPRWAVAAAAMVREEHRCREALDEEDG